MPEALLMCHWPPVPVLQDGQQVVMKTMTRTKLTDKDRQEVRNFLC
jgi:hypothetical protein